MKIEIKEKKENKLLGRLEVSGRLVFEGATPSNEVVKESLAVELKVDKELTLVKSIYSKFSHQEAEFLAFVYDNQEQMDKTEVMTKHLRKKAEEDKKKAAEAKEAAAEKKEEPAKEEKPVEEKKEEKPAEQEKPVEDKPEGKKEEAKLEEKPAEDKKEEPTAEKKPEEKSE